MTYPLSAEQRGLLAQLNDLTPSEQKAVLDRQRYDALRNGAVCYNVVTSLMRRLGDDPEFTLPGRTREESMDILSTAVATQKHVAGRRARQQSDIEHRMAWKLIGGLTVTGVFVIFTLVNPNWFLDIATGIAEVLQHVFDSGEGDA